MKTTMKILPLMLGIMLFFTQCEKEADFDRSVNAEATMNIKFDHNEDCMVEQDLWAGAGQNNTDNGTLVGKVIASITDGELTVEYVVDEPWYATEWHLWVGDDFSDIPRNAAPGRFPYSGSDSYTIDLDELGFEPGDNIYLAAHAVVANDYAADYDAIVLPEEVSFSVAPADNVYLNVAITTEGILFGDNDGWCIDPNLPIGPGVMEPPYVADVYLSTGVLPSDYASFDFGKINWILNFAAPLVPDVYSMGDVQTAIWRVFYGEDYDVAGTEPLYTEDNVLEILANADSDFVPGCDQLVGVILDTQIKNEVELQPLLISIPVPCMGVEETAWAYGGDEENDYTFIGNDIANKWGWFFDMTYCVD